MFTNTSARFASFSVAAVGVLAIASGCATETDATESSQGALAEGVTQAMDAAPAAVEVRSPSAGWTEIASGSMDTFARFQYTRNDPTGDTIRVRVSSCGLTSMSLTLVDARLQPVWNGSIRPAGTVRQFDGSVDLYWKFPGGNLGQVGLGGSGFQPLYNCRVTIYQSGVDRGGSTPPPDDTNPRPLTCNQLDEQRCVGTFGCQANYIDTWVSNGWQSWPVRQFAGCQSAIRLF